MRAGHIVEVERYQYYCIETKQHQLNIDQIIFFYDETSTLILLYHIQKLFIEALIFIEKFLHNLKVSTLHFSRVG